MLLLIINKENVEILNKFDERIHKLEKCCCLKITNNEKKFIEKLINKRKKYDLIPI